MPQVGIFWFDPTDHTFFGVRKQELTPKQVEEALKFGYENTHKEIYGGIGQERFFNENIDLGLLIIDIRSVVK